MITLECTIKNIIFCAVIMIHASNASVMKLRKHSEKAAMLLQVPCYEKPDDVEAILKEKYFTTNPKIIKSKEDGNENSSI